MTWGACVFGLFLLRGKNENCVYPSTSWWSCDHSVAVTQTSRRRYDFGLVRTTRPQIQLYALSSKNAAGTTDNEITDRRQLSPNEQSKFEWLQARLSLTEMEMNKILKRHDRLLGYSIQDNVEPRLDWLQSRFGLNEIELAKLIKASPVLIGLSKDNIESKLQWFEDRLDLDTTEWKKFIPLVTRSTEKTLEPKLQWIQETFDLDDARLRVMVRSFPAILTYSIQTNMARKIQFYSDLLGEEEAKKRLVDNPSFFSYSLERRVQPRLVELEAVGLKVDVDVPFSCLVMYPDKRWSEYLPRRRKRPQQPEIPLSLLPEPSSLSSDSDSSVLSSPSSPSLFILDVDSAKPLPLPPSMANIYPPLQSVPCKIGGDSKDPMKSESQYLKELIVPPNVETLYDFYVRTNQDDHDPSWAVVWPTAVSFTNYLLTNPSLVRGKRVVELGAGVGLVGLTTATLGAKSVVLTDREPLALHCAMSTAAVHGWNGETSSSSSLSSVPLVSAGLLDWEDVGDGKGDAINNDESSFVNQIKGSADVVVASDVLYDGETIELFAKTCQWMLADNENGGDSGGGIVLVTDPKIERFNGARDYLSKSLGSNNFDLEILDLPTPEIDASYPTPKTMDGKDHIMRLQEPTVLIRVVKKEKICPGKET